MGQLIAFPARRRPAHPHREAALQLVYVLAYALGCFLVGPVLVLVAVAGPFVGEPLTSAGALVLLALLWPLCAAAPRRIG